MSRASSLRGCSGRAVVEHIVERLLAEMLQINDADPHTLASVARHWTFTVMREKSVAEPSRPMLRVRCGAHSRRV